MERKAVPTKAVPLTKRQKKRRRQTRAKLRYLAASEIEFRRTQFQRLLERDAFES